MTLKTVCLALGPYRNLTTLTAGMLSLHPNIQVLNHAGKSIYEDEKLNFFHDYTGEKFQNFVDKAIALSLGGQRGNVGGSILFSHAFDHDTIKERYTARYGDTVVKETIQSLFWKESHVTSNLIRSENVDLGAIFASNEQLRFLMPVRNPMDCATSNIKTKHVRYFGLSNPKPSIEEVTVAVLKELRWFLDLQRAHPSRFLLYFEHRFAEAWPGKVADFLGVTADPQWSDDVLRVFEIKNSYAHPRELRTTYRNTVGSLFSDVPDVKDKLLQFA